MSTILRRDAGKANRRERYLGNDVVRAAQQSRHKTAAAAHGDELQRRSAACEAVSERQFEHWINFSELVQRIIET
jgi:hypothetical protein